MMRAMVFALIAAIYAGAANASSYHTCSAPLILAENPQMPPVPELEFVLTLSAQNPSSPAFVAQGQGVEDDKMTPFVWTGTWTLVSSTVHMIGTLKTDPATEWRAQSRRFQDDVLILNIARRGHHPLMVRCLPRERA
ncbi:MAG: hypothetical protein AAF727_05520 [Pseudomonadota bacterium]